MKQTHKDLKLPSSKLVKEQQVKIPFLEVNINEELVDIIVTIRHDDRCGNGHNTFSITGDVYNAGKRGDSDMIACGCVHDYIRAISVPELNQFIKWHLCSTDGPMHYIENTMYHARNTDYKGLEKGEYSAYVNKVVSREIKNNGKPVILYTKNDGEPVILYIKNNGEPVTLYTSETMYTNKQCNPNLEKSNVKEMAKLKEFMDSLEPDLQATVIYEPCEWSKSEGKEIDIEGARKCAIWPDATLEQLSDKDALLERLPALMQAFKADVESLGFIY